MSLELSANDLLILEQARLERLRSFFADTLTFCFIHLDKNNTLEIHCSEPWIVDELLDGIDPLLWYTWVIVGAYSLSIYFAEEEVFQVETGLFGKQFQQMQSL
jgi:hypothetical protein